MNNIEKNAEARNRAYHETKRHSDTMFAFNVYPCTIPLDFTFVPLHWQDSVEIIYVKQGNGIVQVDFDTYAAEAGDIFFVLPGHLHGMQRILRKRMEYENIIFDMNFLGGSSVDLCSQKYLQPLMQGRVELPVHIGKGHVLYGQVSACLDASDELCAGRPDGYELGVKGQLLVMFSILLQKAFEKEGRKDGYALDNRNVQKLKMVLSRIEADYDKRMAVNDMAEECGYSASHFMRWFKESTGMGFYGYLIEYRLGKAAYELQNSNDTVLGIAERTGFDNLSNFNRLFKKRFEMTPRQFRERPW